MKKFAWWGLFLAVIFCILEGQNVFSKEPTFPKFKKDSLSIYLSPSCQDKNIGYGDYGTEEKRMNEVCDVVEANLKKNGIKIYRNDPEKGLRDFVKEANEAKVDLYFAIHSNAANRKARGAECYCYKFGNEGERFAKKVMAALMEIYPGPNRGVKESHSHFGPGKPLYETANPNAPAALVEVAFHDQKDDAEWIMKNKKQIGECLAGAILKHFAEEHPDKVIK